MENRPTFKPHDDFNFEPKKIGHLSRQEFIRFVRESHEHMRELSTIIERYGLTLDAYLEKWDGNLESFDDEVKILLGEWMKDGTLDHIINENLMSIKADKNYVDDLNENVTAQLAQTAVLKVGGGIKAELEDLSENVLSAIEGGEGTDFNLLSIPQDYSVTPTKTSFVEMSPNFFNIETITPNVTLNDVTESRGELVPNELRSVSDFIPVEPNSDYISSGSSQANLTQRFNANKEPVAGLSNTKVISTTSAVRFVRISVWNDDLDTFQFEKGETPTPYQEYGKIKIPNLKIEGIDSLSQTLNEVIGRIEVIENSPPSPSLMNLTMPDSLLHFEELTNTVGYILATSYDGNVYALRRDEPGRSVGFYKSEDSGKTWTLGFLQNQIEVEGGFGQPEAIIVFSDGSVVFISQTGNVIRSSSFDVVPTFVAKLDAEPRMLSINSYEGEGKQYVFAGGYAHTPTKKDMYFSEDGGRTFSVLKEGDTFNSGNNHWHSVAYDPYDDSVWVSQGDGDNSRVYYTSDWGENWQPILGVHPTAIYAFPNRVAFGRDKSGFPPGISEWVKDGSIPTELSNAITFREDKGSFDFYPEKSNWNHDNPDIYYMLFPSHGVSDGKTYIYGTGDGGVSWQLVYYGDDVTAQLTGIDKNGYIYASSGKGSNAIFYRAKAVKWNS